MELEPVQASVIGNFASPDFGKVKSPKAKG